MHHQFLHKNTLKNGYKMGLNTNMNMHLKTTSNISIRLKVNNFFFSAEFGGGKTAAIRRRGSICLISYLVGNQVV